MNLTATGLHSRLIAVEGAIQQEQEKQRDLDFKYQEHKRLSLLSRSVEATNTAIRNIDKKESPASAEAELAAKKALLAQYMTRYTSNHPDIITLGRDLERLDRQIAERKSTASSELTPIEALASPDQKKKAVQSDITDSSEDAQYQFEADGIKSTIAKREKERQDILQEIKQYQSRLNLAPALDEELATLIREADTLKGQCANLQKQKFSTQLATTVETDIRNGTYRVIDEASLPARPKPPTRLQILLMGLGVALAVGIGTAFGRELMDSTISSEQDVKRVLDLPVIVTIPTVPKEKKLKKTA